MSLSDRDRAMLDFEREWWALPGSKERRIRNEFSLAATTYYRLLNVLIETAEALEYDPLVVRRLRRLRSKRRRARFEGRFAGGPPAR
ncbi:MAG: DUF3263 domain-containing protein [Acidimicrobiales bacterium]